MSTLHQKTGVYYLAAFLMLTAGGNKLIAQTNEKKINKPKFSVFINATAGAISLTCTEGCNWKELSFNTIDNNKIYIIDQSGLRTITKNTAKATAKKSKWLFSMSRIAEQLTLEGLKGTSWKKLTLKCPNDNCTESVDQNGITQLN